MSLCSVKHSFAAFRHINPPQSLLLMQKPRLMTYLDARCSGAGILRVMQDAVHQQYRCI